MTDIVVYGRGKTGQSLYELLELQGKSAVYYDDVTDFDKSIEFDSNTTVLLSPGVKPYAFGLQQAIKANAQVVSELDYCYSLCKGKCISVTGTNGKTTTCEMIYHILQATHFPTFLLGNGGIPFSSHVLDVDKDNVVVLESSSFQLQHCKVFAPYVSVFTNFACDHLDYHRSMQEYAQAKTNNFINQKEGYAIFNFDDKLVMTLSQNCSCSILTYSVDNVLANCYLQGDNIVLTLNRKTECVNADYIKQYALHNVSNALAAILACACFGISAQISVNALQDYVFLPHRMQYFATIGIVDFVDDSKATNVHATVSALNCFSRNVALILGGSNKGEQFDEIFLKPRHNLVKVVAVGETAPLIIKCAAKYGISVEKCSDIRLAAIECYRFLQNQGGVVLMSNACASFDSFSGYAQRGDFFQKVVGELYESEKKV